MENTSYIALSYQMALQRQMDIVANNIANMNSTAFRGERALFEEFLVDATNGRELSFVQDFGLIRDTKEGPSRPTRNPLDIAISGKGWLTAEGDDGPRYTRNGHMRIDDEGRLVTQGGLPILGDDGGPLVFEAVEGAITIADDGTISSDAGLIGKINIVTFDNEQEMKKVGDSLYSTEQRPQPAGDYTLLQGMVESSNVEGVVEMTRMMEVVRTYTATQKLMDGNHDLLRRAIGRLGRVTSA